MKRATVSRRFVRTMAVGVLSLLAFGQAPYILAAQFYKPNRAARLVVSLKSKARYPVAGPVMATVMLSNQAMTPLLINGRMLTNRYPLDGELSFVVEGPQGKTFPLVKTVTPREINAQDLTPLGVGETMEQVVNLSDLYGLRKRGKYRLQVIYYSSATFEKNGLSTWRGTIASEPTEFELE